MYKEINQYKNEGHDTEHYTHSFSSFSNPDRVIMVNPVDLIFTHGGMMWSYPKAFSSESTNEITPHLLLSLIKLFMLLLSSYDPSAIKSRILSVLLIRSDPGKTSAILIPLLFV
jgi:hypothetical protein